MKNNKEPLAYIRTIDELRCGARMLADHPERKIKYVWELIISLKEDLEADLKILGAGVKGHVDHSVIIYSKENVLIEEGAEVEAGTVLDARSGPIYVGKGTIIRPQSYLRGPLSIGPECRIGGEVTHSIFHGYSNKAHYGFIGHSYIGEWVNLGAGTTNSNLKNTYGTVKMNGIDTKQQFLGCIIGDFAKLGIGTLIPTGAVVGFGANLFGGGMTSKNVPNFAWGDKEKYRLDDFIKSAELAMKRRGKILANELKKKIEKNYLG
ncbi:MAG: hypothetical protein ABIH50_07385 [bacterium]